MREEGLRREHAADLDGSPLARDELVQDRVEGRVPLAERVEPAIAATFGLTRIRNAGALGRSAARSRSQRSTSIATVSSESTTPSPSQTGQRLVMISRTPSVTFWRVISTSPSGEISTT